MTDIVITPEDAIAILAELKARRDKPKPVFVDDSFTEQARFIRDPAKYKAGFCTRRAGKSFGVGLELFTNAYNNPGVSCLYIALTRQSAQRIMFKDVYQEINRKFNLGCVFNYTNLTVTLPNGSVIYNVGMDSSPEEAEKALGQKFKKVVIDEAGSFRRDLRNIIYGIIGPALTDLNGTLSMIGTPTSFTQGLFYDVVWSKTEPGWSVHKWTARDNPFMREKWHKEVTELVERNPLIVETPYFKQMYLGEYSIDADKLVYKFNRDRNVGVSKLPHNELITVLGIDLGYEDDSAFTVCGYNVHDKNLYVIDTYKRSGMTISDVAERIKYYDTKYKPYKMVVDNANKQAVEEMKQRYQLPLTAADKAGKAEFIEIMNSEMIQGRVIVDPSCDELFTEWENLIWDEKALPKRLEHPACANHLSDSTLYAWRYCYQYLSKPAAKAPSVDEKLEIWFDQEASKLTSTANKPFWERDFYGQ